MIGAAAMSMSSVCVVSNALRLKFFKADNNCVLDDEPAGEINVVSQNEYKGETNMKKEMLIEGMSCMHCSGRVEKALNGLDGVNAKVDL